MKIFAIEIKTGSGEFFAACMGANFKELFIKLYNKNFFIDLSYSGEIDGYWLVNDHKELTLLSDTEDLVKYLLDKNCTITIESLDSDILYNVKDCKVDWEKGEFEVNGKI